MNFSFYELLGLNITSTKEEIENEYKILTKNSFGHTEEYKKEVDIAYETLINNETRKKYDNTLTEEQIIRINNNYSLYNIAKNMFNNLKQNIDKKIEVHYLWDSEIKIVKTKLKEVIPFSYLETDSKTIPFIGKASGIVKITSQETNKVLYENKNINQDYTERSKESKLKKEKDSWGITITYSHYDKWLANEDENTRRTSIKI